jgi:ClpP class serine protease
VDIKVLLQILNGIWLIEESVVNHYATIAERIRNGETVIIESRAMPPFLADASGAPSNNGSVLVVPVNGAIMKYDNCGSPGTQTLLSYINAAQKSAAIQSIVLSIDSPGGAVDGTEEFATAIANSTKPVVAFAHGKMASAAYWMGSAAKEIVISGETTMVGSIGTMATLRKGMSENEQVLFASKSTRKNKAVMDAMNGDTEAYVKNVLDPINNVFTSAVETNRAGKINLAKEDVTQGDIYIGKAAIKAGLADKIGTLDYAIKRSLQLAKTLKN